MNIRLIRDYLAGRYVADAMDESLEQHDKKYHPEGYKEGDSCNKRETMKEEDDADNLQNGAESTENETLFKNGWKYFHTKDMPKEQFLPMLAKGVSINKMCEYYQQKENEYAKELINKYNTPSRRSSYKPIDRALMRATDEEQCYYAVLLDRLSSAQEQSWKYTHQKGFALDPGAMSGIYVRRLYGQMWSEDEQIPKEYFSEIGKMDDSQQKIAEAEKELKPYKIAAEKAHQKRIQEYLSGKVNPAAEEEYEYDDDDYYDYGDDDEDKKKS